MGLLDAPPFRPDVRGRIDRTLPASIVTASNYIGQLTSQTSTGTSRIKRVQMVAACDLRLVYVNFHNADTPFLGYDTDGPSVYTISTGIEIGGQGGAGVTYKVTFGGQLTGTVAPGGILISDPIGLEIAAGTTWYERVNITAAGGTWFPTHTTVGNAAGGGGFTASSDFSHTQSSISDLTARAQYGASVVLGTPTSRQVPSVLIIGDSIASGRDDKGVGGFGIAYGDFSATGGLAGGFATRALTAASIPWLNLAYSGTKFATFKLPFGHLRRLPLASGCTHAICEYGFNDIVQAATLATVQADALTVWGLLTRRGMKVWQTTITPITTTSNGWSDTAGQTLHATNTVRVNFNNWLRAGAPIVAGAAVAIGTVGALLAGQGGHPLSGYFETADAIESARDSGKFKAAPTVAVASGSVTSNVATVVTDTPHGLEAGGPAWIAGMGASFDSASTPTVVSTVPTTTSFTYAKTTANTSVGAGGTVGLVYVSDGTHPSHGGHALMAAAIDTTRFALTAGA